jgi:hypothetical protein
MPVSPCQPPRNPPGIGLWRLAFRGLSHDLRDRGARVDAGLSEAPEQRGRELLGELGCLALFVGLFNGLVGRSLLLQHREPLRSRFEKDALPERELVVGGIDDAGVRARRGHLGLR